MSETYRFGVRDFFGITGRNGAEFPLVESDGKTTLKTMWKARRTLTGRDLVLGTDILTANGELLQDLDHQLIPNPFVLPGQTWQDTVELTKKGSSQTCGLAVYTVAKKACEKVSKGRTDWNGIRLLLEL